MVNRKLHQEILNNPDGLEALQNSFVWPKDWVPYSCAVLEIEKQEFPNFLCEEEHAWLRRKLDHERICFYEHYLEMCNTDQRLKEAEKKRAQARICLNDALIHNYVKSQLYRFDKSKKINLEKLQELDSDWWRSTHAFAIDSLSIFYLNDGNKIISKGAVSLERKSLEKWGAAHPNEPSMSGRKKGSGKKNDDEKLAFMHELVITDTSVLKAAKKAIEHFGAEKHSEPSSQVDRLRHKYVKKYQR